MYVCDKCQCDFLRLSWLWMTRLIFLLFISIMGQETARNNKMTTNLKAPEGTCQHITTVTPCSSSHDGFCLDRYRTHIYAVLPKPSGPWDGRGGMIVFLCYLWSLLTRQAGPKAKPNQCLLRSMCVCVSQQESLPRTRRTARGCNGAMITFGQENPFAKT